MPNDQDLLRETVSAVKELTATLREYHETQIVLQAQVAQLMDERDQARRTRIGIALAAVAAGFSALGSWFTSFILAHPHH